MNPETRRLPAGLYFVATPIGTARDITLRALDVLASADVLAAEDTRTLRHLMQIHGVALRDRQVLAYHDHNGPAMRPKLLAAIANGQSVAYASEAGTPLVADPGYQLAKDAQEAGHLVTSAPGPSAVIAALSVAGLPTDRFMFAGFAPVAKNARCSWLAELNEIPATLVIYESPKRIHRILDDMLDIYGGDRQIAICRELTKKFEEVIRGPLADVIALAADRVFKGEIVLVVDRDRREMQGETMEDALAKAMETMSVKDAAAMVATALGLHKRQVYQAALEMKKK